MAYSLFVLSFAPRPTITQTSSFLHRLLFFNPPTFHYPTSFHRLPSVLSIALPPFFLIADLRLYLGQCDNFKLASIFRTLSQIRRSSTVNSRSMLSHSVFLTALCTSRNASVTSFSSYVFMQYVLCNTLATHTRKCAYTCIHVRWKLRMH